jgi:hypothetical protein
LSKLCLITGVAHWDSCSKTLEAAAKAKLSNHQIYTFK